MVSCGRRNNIRFSTSEIILDGDGEPPAMAETDILIKGTAEALLAL